MKLQLLLLVAFVLAIPAFAFQDDDDPADDALENSKGAYLTATYDQQGAATVNLSMSQEPVSWERMQAALAASFGCSASGFHHPEVSPTVSRYLNRLPAARQQEQLRTIEKQNSLQLTGTCPASLHRSALVFQSKVDTAEIVRELHGAGVVGLELWIQLPEFPYVHVSGIPETEQKRPVNPLLAKYTERSRHLSVAINERTIAPTLNIEYGWSRAVVMRTLIRVIVFVLLPIAVVLRVRSLSLKTFKDDPTGAWFAYMKTLGWCTNGGMLLWYLTNVGARFDLEKLVKFVLPASPATSTAVHLAIYFVPAAIIYLGCISVSHRVFVEVKKAQYTWGQFLAEHSLTLAQTIVPIACVSAAFRLHGGTKGYVILLIATYASAIVIKRWRMKLTKNYPTIALAGELRDRVFEFAKRLGVKLEHVIILPAQRTQIANAFASPSNTVMFTDFLLGRMSKREVDAIAGHELTHLKRSHPVKLSLAMLAACLAPVWLLGLLGGIAGFAYGFMITTGVKTSAVIFANTERVINVLSNWGIDGLIAVVVGFMGVYALSRRFERQADAGAVAVTKDPEAMITALLKLGALNLTPLSWGKGTAASLTHPSTLKRVQKIADDAGISDARLSELIGQFSVDKLSHVEIATVAEQHKEGEHYVAQAAGGEATQKALHRSHNLLVVLIALLVIPPALVELAIERLHLIGQLRTAVYGVGIVVAIALYFFAVKLLSLRGLEKQKGALLKATGASGIKLDGLQSSLVGFAPGPAPRLYLGTYNFDTGLLLLGKDRLVYSGQQVKFSLTRKQVLSIQTGSGSPSWWPQERIYIRWQDESGTVGVFSVSAQDPCSLSQLDTRVNDLYSKLLTWRLRGQPQQLPAELETLPVPKLGEVTCKSPREALTLKIQFLVLVLAGAAIWTVSTLLGIHSGYMWITVVVLRIFETLPYLWYRDPKDTSLPAPIVAKAAAATATASV